MKQLFLAVAAVIAGLAMAETEANALTCSSPITCTNGAVAAATVLTGSATNHGVAIGGAAQALSFAATGSSGQFLKSAGSGSDPSMATIGTGDIPTTVVLESEDVAFLYITDEEHFRRRRCRTHRPPELLRGENEKPVPCQGFFDFIQFHTSNTNVT